MSNPGGTFVLVPYQRNGQPLSPLTLRSALIDDAWQEVLDIVPRVAPVGVLYDADGVRHRIAVAPPDPLTDEADVSALALDSSGTLLATGHKSGDVRLWDATTGEPRWTLSPADDEITGLAFVDEGGWVLAHCDDGPLLVIDCASGELRARADEPQSGTFTLAVAPDGGEVTCTGLPARRWSLPTLEELPALEREQSPSSDSTDDQGITWVSYLPDRAGIVGLHERNIAEVVFWNRDTGARVAALPLTHDAAAADVSPAGTLAVFASSEAPTRLTVIDTRLRSVKAEVTTDGKGVLDLRFAPDGRSILLHDEGVGICVLDAQTLQRNLHIPEDHGVSQGIARNEPVIPEERESAPIVVTHNLSGGVELTQLLARTPVGPAGRSITRDGALYASIPFATDNNLVAVFDLVHATGLATLAHAGNVQEIWFGPDGGRIAVRAAGHVSVWRVPQVPARR